MFFKKKQSEVEVKPSFIQEKLSVAAVERFFQRCADDCRNSKNENADWQFYTLQSGQTIRDLTSSPFLFYEYLYLLAQTAPYHIPNRLSFPLKYMAYTVNETDGKLVPWCTNSKLLSAFVRCGCDYGVIFLLKQESGEITVGLCPSLIPVTHNEGMSISMKNLFNPRREVAEFSPELIAAIKAIDSYSSFALDIINNNYSAWGKLATVEQREAHMKAVTDSLLSFYGHRM